MPAIAVRGTRRARPQVQHEYVQDLRRTRADPRHPLPRCVQPGGPRSEHPGAVRSADRRSRRRYRSVRRSHDHGDRLWLYRAGLGGRCRARRSTRPPSTTASSAATRTWCRKSRPRRRSVSSSSRASCRGSRRPSITSTSSVKGAIQGFGADAILADCVANSTATLLLRPARSSTAIRPGSLWLSPDGFVTDLPHNVGGDKTDGIDVSASYSHPLGGLGGLSASFQGTWVRHFEVDNGLTRAVRLRRLLRQHLRHADFKVAAQGPADLEYADRPRYFGSVASPVGLDVRGLQHEPDACGHPLCARRALPGVQLLRPVGDLYAVRTWWTCGPA